MEKFGTSKRDILIDRIEDGQEASKPNKSSFQCIHQFRDALKCDGGNQYRASACGQKRQLPLS